MIRWESSSDNFQTSESIENTTTTYSVLPNNILGNICFRAFVSNDTCMAYSDTICVTVNNDFPVTPPLYGDQTICLGQQVNQLSLGMMANVIRWESSTDNFNTINTINYTNSNYSPINITLTTQFRVVVQSGGCPPRITNSIEITVNPLPIAGSVFPGENTICPGIYSQSLLLTGQNGNIVYWEFSPNPTFDNNITSLPGSANQITVSTTVPNIPNNISSLTLYYRVRIRNYPCEDVFTDRLS